MSIIIKEYFGAHNRPNITGIHKGAVDLQESLAHPAFEQDAFEGVMVDTEGIHVGPTRNFTWYTKKGLMSSISSWTKPYLKPVIMHHNEEDGRIMGRIHAVSYIEHNTKSGTGALVFTSHIPGEQDAKDVKNGIHSTVSIGVIVHEAICSICGANMAAMSEDEIKEHEHVRGRVYDGKICYWFIENMEGKELSYVVVPSDNYAQNIKVYKPKQSANLKEDAEKGVFNVTLAEGLEAKESAVLDENGEKAPPQTEEINNNVDASEEPKDSSASQDEDNKQTSEQEQNQEEEKNELEELKAELANVKATLEDKDRIIEETKNQLQDANDKLAQVQAALDAAKSNLAAAEERENNEKALRETAENELVVCQTQLKEALIDKIMLVRESLNKHSIDRSEFNSRSIESIQDTVKDLAEEAKQFKIQNVENPGFSIQSQKSVKEEKNTGNMQIEETFKGLLSDLFNGVKY